MDVAPPTAAGAHDASVPPPAVIRPFTASTDLKITRYLIGATMMEPSSVANQTALWTPFALVVWVLLAQVLVTFGAGGWPSTITTLMAGQGIEGKHWAVEAAGWLKLIPALLAPPIVLLASFELRHRNMFEEEMTRAIGEEDMRDVEGYYGVDALKKKTGSGGGDKQTGGRKGFWVLEYDGRIIGAFGVDGRKPGVLLDSVVDLAAKADKKIDDEISEKKAITDGATATSTPSSPYPLRNRAKAPSTPVTTVASSSTSETVHLRRFGSSLSFRSAGIDSDLLNYATAFAFSTSSPSSLPPASAITYTLRPKIETKLLALFKQAGFKDVEKGAKGEIIRYSEEKGLLGSLLERFWPLDLGVRTLILQRSDWERLNK